MRRGMVLLLTMDKASPFQLPQRFDYRFTVATRNLGRVARVGTGYTHFRRIRFRSRIETRTYSVVLADSTSTATTGKEEH